MQPCKSLHPSPSPVAATTLTAPTDHRQPEPCDFIDETAQALAVVRDGVIIQPALNNASQPAARFANRSVQASPQFLFDLRKGRTHSFGNAMTMDREPAVLLR
jgi:hypothetical protein